MRQVAVIGVGINKWGELWKKSLRDIFVESALLAIDDAGIDKIDAMYVGSMTPGIFTGQEHLGALLADYLGRAPIPSTRVESACASGGVALIQGFIDVASGLHDIVLVGGVEKMTDLLTEGATYALAAAADREYEAFQGLTFPGLYAMIANRYKYQFGLTREELSWVAVKNHRNGSLNPKAQYPFEITLEAVEKSPMVADPLRVLDCSPITDGAAVVILAPLEKVKEPKVEIIGIGQATDRIALHQREDLTEFRAVRRAAEEAYKMAHLKPEDIDLAEVHDCFTIAEICVIEALGFFDRGKGKEAAKSGLTALDGKIPVNTSGGLKSKGHPVGATGVAQVVEITEQLRGEAGKRQVRDVRVGLCQNMGGSGASSTVTILKRV